MKAYTEIKGVDAPTLAKEFCKILREYLTTIQIAEVIERNNKETSDAVCHTHDFCDANMVMQEAGERHGLDFAAQIHGDMEESHHNLWCEAWSLAKYGHHFDPERIDETVADIEKNGY